MLISFVRDCERIQVAGWRGWVTNDEDWTCKIYKYTKNLELTKNLAEINTYQNPSNDGDKVTFKNRKESSTTAVYFLGNDKMGSDKSDSEAFLRERRFFS